MLNTKHQTPWHDHISQPASMPKLLRKKEGGFGSPYMYVAVYLAEHRCNTEHKKVFREKVSVLSNVNISNRTCENESTAVVFTTLYDI